MKIKTSELTGPALDWAVSKCEGVSMQSFLWAENQRSLDGHAHFYNYSTNSLSGFEIIEREGINLRSIRKPGHSMGGLWLASPANQNTGQMVQWVEFLFGNKRRRGFWRGETPLIAAMRCYVASKLGDEIEIPEELV